MNKRNRENERSQVSTQAEATSTTADQVTHVVIQLVDEEGQSTGAQFSTPVATTNHHLDELLNGLLNQEGECFTPYAYFIDSQTLQDTIGTSLLEKQKEAYFEKMRKEGRRIKKGDMERIQLEVPSEQVINIVYRPQAVFKVLPVTRCTAALSGHSEAVLVVMFSPDGTILASGSGDRTVRLWDLYTETPIEVLQGHKSWVQALGWSPNGTYLASGSMDGELYVWKDSKGNLLKGHKKFISSISWEPLHQNLNCDRFVSSSKDGTLKIWNIAHAQKLTHTLSGHTSCVTCVKWGGNDLIYSSSEDRTAIVWCAKTGTQKHILKGHAHWINRIALNTDLVLRSGSHDHTRQAFPSAAESAAYAQQRFSAVVKHTDGEERLVTCSDDKTLFLWAPVSSSSKPLARLHGHQGLIFGVVFSPDGAVIASCSQDKSVKLWRGRDGQFIRTLRGHVGCVYHIAWSLDSRQLISASRDTTVKLWDASSGKLISDLPGHADEVYAADWSPDGLRVASGSKDKTIRLWRH